MQTSLPASARRPRAWNRSTHACLDDVVIHRRLETTEITVIDKLERKISHTAPRSGVWLKFGLPLAVDAGGTVADRPMTTFVRGGPTRTYALPRTTKIVGPHAFQDTDALASVRLNEGLEALGENCFEYSGLERLVLPASVTSVGERAFTQCEHLRYADLRAAHGLRSLERHAFYFCTELKQALLNEGLEEIGAGCFYQTGLEVISFPRPLKSLGDHAFQFCGSLRRVAFAGDGPERIGRSAFMYSGLEAFIAPPSLRSIGEYALAECPALALADLSACLRSAG